MESSSKQHNQEGPDAAPTIDLWTLASNMQSSLGNQTSEAGGDKQGQGNNVTSKNECTFVFLGDKQSGKTSLIAKLLDEPLKDDVKETTALDFRYGSRVKDDKKQKINIYELGGGRTLSQLLQAPINAFSLSSGTTVVCIVVDLANPGASVDALLFWLATVREHVSKAASEISSKLSAEHQQQFEAEMSKIRAQTWEKHEDRAKVQPLPLPVIVIGSKFDIFANQFESVKRKQVCLALRYICHSAGCDLVYSSTKEKLPAQLYKAMLSRHLGQDQQLAKVERDHNQPLNIYGGSDSFAQIGEPEGAGMRRNIAFERLWQELIESQIPKNAASTNKDPAQVLGDMRRYLEDKVDSMRQQKDEELEQYKKEIERAKRFENQKALGGSAAVPTDKIVVKRKAIASGAQGNAAAAGGSSGASQPAVVKRRVQQPPQ